MPETAYDAVLVTGGAGSLGTALVDVLLERTQATVRVLDISEYNLDRLQEAYGKSGRIRALMGDVRSLPRLKRAMEDVDACFHLAALKHVSIGQFNPAEVHATNVQGTQNVVDAVLDERRVRVCMLCSTDKAVNPTTIYGRSKAMAEDLVLYANRMKGDRPTAFSVYRPGNFFLSSGSVVEKWLRQRESGVPLTVTPGMRRYFIGLGRAAELMYEASLSARGGEIFVPKMMEYGIDDLADLFGGTLVDREPVSGEKLREELYSEEEAKHLSDEGDMWCIRLGS